MNLKLRLAGSLSAKACDSCKLSIAKGETSTRIDVSESELYDVPADIGG